MKNKIERKINSQRRITLTKDFCNYVGIEENANVAICKGRDDKEILVLNYENARKYEIIAFSKIDTKYRVLIPIELVEEGDEVFEISIVDNAIVIREATTK